MVKAQKVHFSALLFVALFSIGIAASSVALAVTDPEGNVIIEEQDIRLTPQEVQQKEDDAAREKTLATVILVLVVLAALGGVIYIGRANSKSSNSKTKKKSSKV